VNLRFQMISARATTAFQQSESSTIVADIVIAIDLACSEGIIMIIVVFLLFLVVLVFASNFVLE